MAICKSVDLQFLKAPRDGSIDGGLAPRRWPEGLPTSEMSSRGKFVPFDLESLCFVVKVKLEGSTNEKKDRKSKKEGIKTNHF